MDEWQKAPSSDSRTRASGLSTPEVAKTFFSLVGPRRGELRRTPRRTTSVIHRRARAERAKSGERQAGLTALRGTSPVSIAGEAAHGACSWSRVGDSSASPTRRCRRGNTHEARVPPDRDDLELSRSSSMADGPTRAVSAPAEGRRAVGVGFRSQHRLLLEAGIELGR